jgi:hypothetical protein
VPFLFCCTLPDVAGDRLDRGWVGIDELVKIAVVDQIVAETHEGLDLEQMPSLLLQREIERGRPQR